MKKAAFHNKKITRVYAPLVIGFALLAILFIQWQNYFTSLSALFLIPILLLFLSPQGKTLLGSEKKVFIHAFFKIVLFQLAVLIIFYSICQTYITYYPLPVARGGISESEAWSSVAKSFFTFGLFPWT